MSAALRISLIYLLLASAWIWLSDSFAHLLPIPTWWSTDIQTLKGELFVTLTAGLLYWLIRREERRQEELQAELRQTRARLEHFVDVSPAVIYVFEKQDAHPRLRLAYLSANIERLTGFSATHFFQHPATAAERLHPDDQARVREHLRRAADDGTELNLQYRWLHCDGQYRWIEDRATINRNPMTGKTELVGNWRDISQSKQDELRLQAAEERWRFAIDGSEIGLWDWNVPDNTVFFSTRWKTMLGHEDSEIGNALSEWSSRVHPDDLPAVQADVEKLLSTPHAQYSNEHRVRCKDGSYIWILDRGKVVERNEQGDAVRVIGTHTDLSALKQREAALDLHAGVFMNSLEGIVICGPDQRIESVNRTFTDITGYTAEEAIGQQPSFLSSGRHDTDFYRQMWQQIEQTGRWQGEIWNRPKVVRSTSSGSPSTSTTHQTAACVTTTPSSATSANARPMKKRSGTSVSMTP